jgi:hypothetical protein
VPEAVPAVRPWPRPVSVFLLLVYVAVDAALWLLGFYHLFLGIEHLGEAGQYLTLALVVMLVGGWAWRWAVAAGRIGGRPTARFGGA